MTFRNKQISQSKSLGIRRMTVPINSSKNVLDKPVFDRDLNRIWLTERNSLSNSILRLTLLIDAGETQKWTLFHWLGLFHYLLLLQCQQSTLPNLFYWRAMPAQVALANTGGQFGGDFSSLLHFAFCFFLFFRKFI